MSSEFFNFRISVESVVLHHNKILLVKRTIDCKVAPGVWNVPAGKVNFLETTSQAVVRETWEETGIKVRVIKFLSENACQVKSDQNDVYRNVFTYLTQPIEREVKVTLNREHSEYAWILEEELSNPNYSSLLPLLRENLKQIFSEASV